MWKLGWVVRACGIILLWATAAVALPAQTFTVIHSLNGADGSTPYAGLVQGTNGKLYGTTFYGGAVNSGTVFSITTAGVLTSLHSFCSQSNCTDGSVPYAGLLQATNGKFYGTTQGGGVNSKGTAFTIAAGGTLTTLHSFADEPTDGALPYAGLVQGINGKFYGETLAGGAGATNNGTIFSITAGGTLATLHSFNGTDGDAPQGGLVQGTNGKFYGTAYDGGANGDGTVFSITAGGTLTTLHNFDSTDGMGPVAGLVQGANGKFYGTTEFGGASANCSSGCGTVFSITAGGTLAMLHSFVGVDGSGPDADLVQGTDGNFYGTTYQGGANSSSFCPNGCGTIFKITPGGTLTTLYSFCSQTNCTDGEFPFAGLVQDTNGKFYGTAQYGGATGFGAIFSLSVGLGPFVKALPITGPVGSAVDILGTTLTGSTSVTFNGTPATFSIVSATEITTTVPTGATTGTVQVVTPGGTLSSNVPFTVK